VALDFAFFERSLHQPRLYRVWSDWEREIVRRLADLDGLDILAETEDETLIRAVNLMDPGTPEGVKPIEERFGIRLPRELHEFYRRWNGGVLVYRTLYSVLSVEDIVTTALELRELHEVPPDLPWHAVRFCELQDSDCLALRKRQSDAWEVVWAGCDRTDLDLLRPDDPREDCNCTLDPSFLHWLRRMDETDGWPWGEHIMLPSDKAPCKRVWQESSRG
jgi:hypothetical protein